MPQNRVVLVWTAVAVAILIPVVVAARSPLLAWRDAVYIAAGFAGILGLAVLLLQPLLAGGHLPGLTVRTARQVHRGLGVGLVVLVVAHVVGLWITSAPDVIDALLFQSPTSFSPWGVVAMWAVFATALLAAVRRKLRLSPAAWRIGHTGLALVIVVGTIVHALLIDGAMGTVSKAAFSLLVAAATARLVFDLAVWMQARRRRA